MQARTSLALTWLLLDRPEEARALVAGLDADGTVRERVNLLATRAVAEMELGDLVEARRLLDLADRIEPADAVLTAADTLLPAAARRLLQTHERKRMVAEPAA
jgi:hypothetical protein